jgi:hypothetical protein
MPEKGRTSITVTEELRDYLKEILVKYRDELRRERVKSIPTLIHYLAVKFDEEMERKRKGM